MALPSGSGQNVSERSLSVVLASNHGAVPVAGAVTVDTSALATAAKQDTQTARLDTIAASLARQIPFGALTSAAAGASNFFVIPVTTSSVAFNLAGANYVNLLAAIAAGKALKFKGDGDVYYRWGTATGTVDETKTAADTPLNQAEHLFAGERDDFAAPPTATWLMVKGPVATFLRITITEP